MTGGSRITFTPLAQLTLPPFDPHPSAHLVHNGSALPASFCTAFSPSGSKFAVASQEGMVAVWDVRSRKPMKVFTTDRSRLPPGGAGGMSRNGSRPMGTGSGWLYEDTWDWTMPAHRAPGWGVRNVKFSSGIDGKELMTFTEVRHSAPWVYSREGDLTWGALAHVTTARHRRDDVRARRDHPRTRDRWRSSTICLAAVVRASVARFHALLASPSPSTESSSTAALCALAHDEFPARLRTAPALALARPRALLPPLSQHHPAATRTRKQRTRPSTARARAPARRAPPQRAISGSSICIRAHNAAARPAALTCRGRA